MIKFNNFDEQILNKKLKLIDINSNIKQEENLKKIYDDFNKRLEEINEMKNKINILNNNFFENCVDNKIEQERQKIQKIENILENEEINSLFGNEIEKIEKFIKDELEKFKIYENYSKSFIFVNNIFKKKQKKIIKLLMKKF